jgi:ribonuclease P/MRP protein subunit POP1
MSYMSTIGLEGPESSLEGALKALGVDGNHAWGTKGRKWRAGSRSLETWMFERDGERRAIAPVTIIWCANPKCEAEDVEMADVDSAEAKKTTKRREIRKIFMRVHPSAFLQLWEELLKVAKIQKPQVMVEDLRFEIGSIDIIGPGSTEALLGALRSGQNQDDKSTTEGSPEEVWTSLAGLTNPASLPQNALLSFNVTDPRLRFPPRTIKPPTSEDTYTALANLLSAWPPDTTTSASDLFSRPARLAASRLLPSQKAINRRKALAPPGQYPSPKPDDPNIPVLAFPSRAGGNARDSNSQAYWTVLLPWKCVKPVWYAIMYYPLSSGGNPRFGGIQEKQQLAFESGLPWFPGDFPGTKAGWEWGERERRIQKHQWERKPKGKRVEFDSLDLGEGRKKGEVGRGWACDWECLLAQPDKEKAEEPTDDLTVGDAKENHDLKAADEPMPPCGIHEVVPSAASSLLSHRLKSTRQQLAQTPNAALATVKINLLYRGTPTPRARIYRLPATDSKLRIQWLSLLVDSHPTASKKPNGKNMTSHKKQSLVYPPSPPDDADMHPPIPGEEDLIGFVTAGGYNLSAGNGTAIAAVLIDKIVPISSGGAPPDGDEDGSKIVWDAARLFGKERIAKLCIVRSAGEKMGRLGQWESV